MNPINTYYETLANTVIKNLEKRQIEGYYCPTSADAVAKALSFVSEGSTVSFGGSVTLSETGMLDALRNLSSVTLLDRDSAPDRAAVEEIFRKSFFADTYFMSSNAITSDGELVNIDGNGNRVAALVFGPKEVIILAGMNKIVPSVEEAVSRVHHTATPLNCIRLNKKTPCTSAGVCADCLSPDCICNQVVITRRSGVKGRIKVLLIGETLGY